MDILPPGKPGIEPRWTSSAKIGIGTALSAACNVWFTLSHGILNEVYFPRIDTACIRDMGFLVTDGREFFSDEKRHTEHNYALVEEGVFAHVLTNKCLNGNYEIKKTIITDPRRDVLLQEIQFIPLKGTLENYQLFLLLAPHIQNAGYGNSGWVGEYKGTPALFAMRNQTALACTSSHPFLKMSCGYVGISDLWQDLFQHKTMTAEYSKATDGNICLGAQIDLIASQGKCVIALGFAETPEEAALQTRFSLSHNFSFLLDSYLDTWQAIHDPCCNLCKVDKEGGKLFRYSIGVLQTHRGKRIRGSNIASLSIPWGFDKGDNEIGGYHLIWPRDQVQSVYAFLAADDIPSAHATLRFLLCTQEEDGHWSQNFWVDGRSYWTGIQMDETALPILLADILRRRKLLIDIDPAQMVCRAANFIVYNGPTSMQDRWEENAGYNPYTIATQIAALLAAADYFDHLNKPLGANYLRDVADWWNENLESWLYVTGTALAEECGVEGYYVRITPTSGEEITIKNRPPERSVHPYSAIVSVDALALVRFGVRSAQDPRILNTIRVIDKLLKRETPRGPVWHRYNEDGYGEKEDGSAFDGIGVGRGWPLLVGERAHYELAKGDRKTALFLLRTMTNMAGVGGLFPEQIWDSEDIPEKKLYKGHSTGSAKPLAWAHAEYITLLRSIRDGQIFGMPPQTVERYIKKKTRSKYAIWRFNDQITQVPEGHTLRIQLKEAAKIRWSVDEWGSYEEVDCIYLPALNLYYADIKAEKKNMIFTFYWLKSAHFENRDYRIQTL